MTTYRPSEDDDLDALLTTPTARPRRGGDVYAGDVDIDGIVGWGFRLTVAGWVRLAAVATLLAAVAGLALVWVLPTPSLPDLPSIDWPEVTWPW